MEEQPGPLPFWVKRFLRLICPDHLYEEIEGDLIEKFEFDLQQKGRTKAKLRLIINTIRFLRPGILLRSKFSPEFRPFQMLRAHFTIARRHLMRSKTFSIINALGLAVGMIAFVLIVQYVSFETSFDRFHINHEEIYRVAFRQVDGGEVKATSAMNFGVMRRLIRENLPEVAQVTGFSPMPNNLGFLIHHREKMFLEPGKFLRADSNFFKVFPSLLGRGDPETVLNDLHSMVISAKVARKIFGTEDPVGQNLGDEYIITGILNDFPENSHIHADFVVRASRDWDDEGVQWGSPDFYTYVTIPLKKDPFRIESKINSLLEKAAHEHPEIKGSKAIVQPITSIHLTSQLQSELEINGNRSLVIVMAIIGALILIIAWINYVNIETARLITRLREVGVRRVIGSGKTELAMQFLVEYFCLNLFSLVLAACGIILLLPSFRFFTGVPVSGIISPVFPIWIGAGLFFVIGSFLAGLYPVWFLLKINPALIIKGITSGLPRGARMRRALVVVQFCASLGLIGFLMIVSQQLDYLRLSNKKIDLDKVIAIRNPTAYGSDLGYEQDYKEFKQLETDLLRNPAVKMVSSSSAIPGTEIGFTFVNLLKRHREDPYSAVRYKMLFVDFNFIPLYNLKLKAGRNFNPANGEDTGIWNKVEKNEKLPADYYQTLILNETAVRLLGFNSNEEAIDQIVHLVLWADDFEKYKIIGILEDYHHESLKKSVNPLILTLNQNKFQQVYYSVKLGAGTDPSNAVHMLEASWKKFFPAKPFDYFFLDDYYDQQFKAELHFERIFGMFAGVAVFLACLGILGMTLFEANARLKEICIRKVLGASVSGLIRLLTRDHVRMILIAALVSVPLIYITGHNWLETYPVRIDVSVFHFLIPLGAIMVLVLLTAAFQTTKAAQSNPVEHLKND